MHRHPRMPGVEARAGRFPGPSLIPELTAIQSRLGWLPREELVALARRTRRPLYEIEGLVSFYPHLRTEAPPAVTVHACRDLPCWLAGSAAGLADRYGPDVQFREVSCQGRCDIAPAVAVNEHPARAADALVAAARDGTLGAAHPATSARGTPWPAPDEPRYQVLRGLLSGSVTPGEVISTLIESGLRGMGGAGSGARVALAQGTDLLAAATNVLRFFRDESCGKCVPCRVGCTKAHLLLSSALAGGGLDDAGATQLTELDLVMHKTSICGLGQVALGPVISVLTLPASPQTS
jgi:NADH:ubiquinone oxidoreductase subunit E